MQERHACEDCGRLSPPTETGYTLLSKEFGWRLTRQVRPDGTLTLEWRCQSCWAKHKVKLAAAAPKPPPSTPRPYGGEDPSLTMSGEHSRAVYDEAYPPDSAPTSKRMRTIDPADAPASSRGLPRKPT